MTQNVKTVGAKAKPVGAKAQVNAAVDPNETDPLYIKAKNEIGGYTLVPLSKVEGNYTVERVGEKVYGEMVIAKRVVEPEFASTSEGDDE